MNNWKDVKNILCIRPDNMGDVLMAEPALRALKTTFESKITLLTSNSGAKITRFLGAVDETIVSDLPWIKAEKTADGEDINLLAKKIKKLDFDASVVFTNYSQNSAPSAMLSYLAQIPLRLGYSRENIYGLLTHWVYDLEPFVPIKHGVLRNLDLVRSIGAYTNDLRIRIKKNYPKSKIKKKLLSLGVDIKRKFLVLHPYVKDDAKRLYPLKYFGKAAVLLKKLGFQIIITGEDKDQGQSEKLFEDIGAKDTFNLTGKFSLKELISLIDTSSLLIANNTGLVHVASALNTPLVVMYARTNMEHAPWMAHGKVIYFDPDKKSKTPILYFSAPKERIVMPDEHDIVNAVLKLTQGEDEYIQRYLVA